MPVRGRNHAVRRHLFLDQRWGRPIGASEAIACGRMRVVIAPDKFAGTLSASEAAAAIAAGWRRTAPADELELVPLADGGPGFVEVLHASLGGTLLPVTVVGPLGDPVDGQVLLVDGTAYVEAAQACGLHLVPPDRRDPTVTTTYGVGELITAGLLAGARDVVVGLGGSATNDAGAGMLAALGATAQGENGDEAGTRLRGGGLGLRDVAVVDLSVPRRRLAGIRLVAASDVDNPLLGLRGATNGFGPQKGATQEQVMALEGALERFATAVGRDARGQGPGGGARCRRGRWDRVRAARAGRRAGTGHRVRARRGGPRAAGGGGRPRDHGGGQLRLAEPARQGRGRRRRGGRWSTAGRCWCSPGGSRSTSGSTPRAGCPARTRSSRASRPAAFPRGRVRAAGAAPRRPRRAGRPYLVELDGSRGPRGTNCRF